jgi:hypothetical protein
MCRHLCLSDSPALSEVMSSDESSPEASDALGERMTRGRRMSSNLGNVCFGAAAAWFGAAAVGAADPSNFFISPGSFSSSGAMESGS